MNPIKGELYFAHLKGQGSVQHGIRPALIVQGDFINRASVNTTIVCPLTTRFRNLSTHVHVAMSKQNGLDVDSEIIAEQVAVINKSQLIRKIGELSSDDMSRVQEALLLIFDISLSSESDDITF